MLPRLGSMVRPVVLMLAGCAAGLGCSLAPLQIGAATTTPDPAGLALSALEGTKAAGTKKASPFAAAKESDDAGHDHLRVDRGRLWWLVVPVGLGLISYHSLRRREQGTDS
jgi:hypothetical protein